MKEKKFPVEISVIFPSRNEGANVSKVLDELLFELDNLGRTYEVIAIDSPTENSSFEVYQEYADKNENMKAVDLSFNRPAGNDKAVKYMIGFSMARGKYILHIDSDGQDNPADLKKFIDQLDDGADLVVGHKQKRKDGKIYMISSKIGNGFTRMLTGVNVHDMNCGFKGYKHHVAKGLNIKGRWYRYIPAIVSARGYKVVEVPIENRKREWGTTNFNFRNRLEGGLFDMPAVIAVTKMGDTPLYFWGWTALVVGLLSVTSLLVAVLFLSETIIGLYILLFGGVLLILLGMIIITALTTEYSRFREFESIESYGIREVYPEN